MMNKGICILLCICTLVASCRKAPSLRRTGITGQVTHYGKGYPEPNIKVIAAAYYTKRGFYSVISTKIVDSTITDQNGNYSLQFSMDISTVDSIYVSGYDTKISSSARVEPGKINQHVNLAVSTQLPVVLYDLHIANNDYPPLVLTFSPVDSIIINAQTDNVKAYRVNSSLFFSSHARNYDVNASFSGYYYDGPIKKTAEFLEVYLPYQDTLVVSDTVNAATFK